MRISDWSSDVCSSDLFSKIHGVQRVGDRQFLQLVLNPCALAHPGGVDQAHVPHLALGIGPFPIDRDAVARNPRFRPSDQPVLAQYPVNERRFRSDERRVGKERVSTCKYWWTLYL